MLGDLRSNGLEIGARAHMFTPAGPRRLQSLLELAEGRGELVQHFLRHPEAHERLLMRGRVFQRHATRREQRLVTRIRGRQRELVCQLPALLRRHPTHDAQISQDLALQRAPDFFPVLGGLARHRHPNPLLPREHLRALQQLLELREPETLPNTVRLMSPQEIADSLGHLQPPAQLRPHTFLLRWHGIGVRARIWKSPDARGPSRKSFHSESCSMP